MTEDVVEKIELPVLAGSNLRAYLDPPRLGRELGRDEESPDGITFLLILPKYGDKRYNWNPRHIGAIKDAEEFFIRCLGEGLVAYYVDAQGNRAREMAEFDPHAGEFAAEKVQIAIMPKKLIAGGSENPSGDVAKDESTSGWAALARKDPNLFITVWRLEHRRLEHSIHDDEEVFLMMVRQIFEGMFTGLRHLLEDPGEFDESEGQRRTRVMALPLREYMDGVLATGLALIGWVTESRGGYLTPEAIHARLGAGRLEGALTSFVERKICDPEHFVDEIVLWDLAADLCQIPEEEEG